MPKILIWDELLAPRAELTVSYTGKNPFLAVASAPKIIRDVMKIPGKDLLEPDIRWDVLKDMRGFYGIWVGKRREDRWSMTNLRLIIQGEQSTKDKTGWVVVRIKGQMETTYEYTNFLQRSFWWFFNYGFYYKQRRQYLEFSKDNAVEMKGRFEDLFGIRR